MRIQNISSNRDFCLFALGFQTQTKALLSSGTAEVGMVANDKNENTILPKATMKSRN